MNTCPTCYRDLNDQIDRGTTTGLWRFRVHCECGDVLIWEHPNRLRSIFGPERQPVS